MNKEKCKFAKESVEFLGFVIDKYGIHPCEEKIHTIEKTPAPRNFYDRFIPHKATVAEHLYRLLDKEVTWQWNNTHQKAFITLREMLSSKDTLSTL